jgi:hypothetical protein
MAPEQAMAQEIGPWTDLYSVGVMAYEFFAGRTPFHDTESPVALLLRHVNEEVPPLRSVAPDVAPDLSDWVGRLLVKDPVDRTRSALAAWEELEDLAIALLGPRWRRQARLTAGARLLDTPKPLTPAPFEGTGEGPATPPADVAVPSESDWVTFAPRGAAEPTPDAGGPGVAPALAPPPAPVAPAPAPPPRPSPRRPRRLPRPSPRRRRRRARPARPCAPRPAVRTPPHPAQSSRRKAP